MFDVHFLIQKRMIMKMKKHTSRGNTMKTRKERTTMMQTLETKLTMEVRLT